MKFPSRFLLGLALCAACAGAAFAQSAPDNAPPGGAPMDSPSGQMARHAPDPQRQTARLARKLQLTPQQSAQIEPILQSRLQQMQQLRANTALAPADRHAQMRAIMQGSNNQLQAILSDSQRQQYQQMQQQAMQRHQQMKTGSPDNDPDGQ